MVRQFSETGVPMSGLAPEQVVFLGVLASMAVMLAGGVALAVLVALILRGLARRATVAAMVEPGEDPAAAGVAMLESREDPGPTRPAAELLRNPWVGGIAAIAVLFWGLAVWSYFRVEPGEQGPPDPAAIRAGQEQTCRRLVGEGLRNCAGTKATRHCSGGGHRVLVAFRSFGSGV